MQGVRANFYESAGLTTFCGTQVGNNLEKSALICVPCDNYRWLLCEKLLGMLQQCYFIRNLEMEELYFELR